MYVQLCQLGLRAISLSDPLVCFLYLPSSGGEKTFGKQQSHISFSVRLFFFCGFPLMRLSVQPRVTDKHGQTKKEIAQHQKNAAARGQEIRSHSAQSLYSENLNWIVLMLGAFGCDNRCRSRCGITRHRRLWHSG